MLRLVNMFDFQFANHLTNRLRFLCSNQSLLQVGGQYEVRWWPCSPDQKLPNSTLFQDVKKRVMIDPLWNQLGTCKMRIRRLLYVWYWKAFPVGATLVSAGPILNILNAIVAWVWYVFLCTRFTCRFVVLQARSNEWHELCHPNSSLDNVWHTAFWVKRTPFAGMSLL